MARHARFRVIRDEEGRWRVWDREMWCYVGDERSFDRTRMTPLADTLNANVRVRKQTGPIDLF